MTTSQSEQRAKYAVLKPGSTVDFLYCVCSTVCIIRVFESVNGDHATLYHVRH